MTYDEYMKKYHNTSKEDKEEKKQEKKPQSSYQQYMQKYGQVYQSDFSSKGSSMLQDFSSAYRSFVESANSDFKTLGYANARDMQTAASKNAADLRTRASSLKTFLAANRGYMSDKDYADALSFINSATGTVDNAMSQYNNSLRYYSQFATQKDYDDYVTAQKDHEDKVNYDLDAAQKEIDELERRRDELAPRQTASSPTYYSTLSQSPYAAGQQSSTGSPTPGHSASSPQQATSPYAAGLQRNPNAAADQEIRDLNTLISQKKAYMTQAKHIQDGIVLAGVANNADFAEYSGYASTESDGFFGSAFSQYSMGYDDLTYEYINGKDNGMRQEILHKAIAFNADNSLGEMDKWKIYDHMTSDEVGIYNYYYAKDGKAAAQKYLDNIRETLNYRKATSMYKPMEGNTALELLFGVVAGLDQFESGIKNLFNTHDSYIPHTATQIASGMVREDLADNGPKLPQWMGGASLGQVGYDAKTLNEMSLDDLKEMYEILRAIEETLQDARKLIGWGDAESVYEAGNAIVAEQNAITKSRNNSKRNAVQKARDASLNLSLSPVRNVERMSGYNGDSALLKLFRKFEQGIRKKNKFVMEAYKSFEGLTSGKEYENAMYTEMGGKKYTDIKGRKFGISKMQMMQAVLSYEREAANNLHHIENGGFTFADLDTLRKGKLKDAISAEYSHRVPAAANLVAEFNEALKNDQWCQAYMAAARKFFDGAAKDAINETGIALKHRIIAKDKNYIPFEVDKNFINREISAANDVQQTINSYGMLKDVKDGAPQPLIITGLNNVLDRHIDMVGNVYGLAVEVRNYNKVWNLRSGNNQTVKEAIETNWGKEGVAHIEQAVQDIQGPRIRERNALYNKVKSNYISATFLLNLSVVAKQIGSLFSATSMLRWRGPVRQIGNLVWTMVNHKKIAAEVDKYTATAWMRRQGLSDAELHTLLTQAKKPGLFRLWEKAPAAINPAKWITAMDSAVALSLWKYAKQDTAKRTGLKGEELLKATAEFYDEVVENTQSMTDVLHRPEIQKRSDILSESFAMFKTDLYQMAGQLQVTAGRFTANRTKENGMALGRTVYAITMSAVWGQLMTTVFALLRYKVKQYRDEEDEELTYESWLKRQGFGFAGDLMGYIFPIFGSETVGIFENIMYGESDDIADSIVLTAINNLYDMMITVGSSFKEGEMPEPAKMKQLVIKALQVFGVPANNIIRTYEAIHLHAKDIANGEFLSFEAGIDRSPKHHIHRITEAMDEGKIDVAIGLYEEALEETAMGKTEDGSYGRAELKDAESSLKSALGNKFKDGEISRALTIEILTSCFGSEKDEAERTVREWAFRVEHGFSYSDQKQQFMAGNITASEVRSNIMAVEGKTEEEAESRIVGYCRDAYEEGYFTRNEAASAMIVYGGMDKSEAEDKLRYIDVRLQFSDTYVNDAWVDEYYKEVESSGISIEVFVDYRNQVKGIKGEGEKERRMAVIDSLPISDEQKDALYFAEGWAASKIDEAPWH